MRRLSHIEAEIDAICIALEHLERARPDIDDETYQLLYDDLDQKFCHIVYYERHPHPLYRAKQLFWSLRRRIKDIFSEDTEDIPF